MGLDLSSFNTILGNITLGEWKGNITLGEWNIVHRTIQHFCSYVLMKSKFSSVIH